MARPRNAKELFDFIKKRAFADVDVAAVVNMTEAEQQEFMLEQTDRLLAADNVSWIDIFWTRNSDFEREMRQPYAPFFNPKEREAMDDDEKMLCAFYITMSGFVFDIVNHMPLELNQLGIVAEADDMFVDNEPLVNWIETTKYESIAVHLAYTLYQTAINQMIECFYQPAQDYLAELICKEDCTLIQRPIMEDVPAPLYIKTIITALKAIDHHISEGLAMGLCPEEIFIHDDIYGHFVENFDKDIVEVAKRLNSYLNTEYKKYHWLGRIADTNIRQQPPHIKKQMNEFVDGFIDKVHEERKDFGEGWLKDDSLAMGYLIAIAEHKAYGDVD